MTEKSVMPEIDIFNLPVFKDANIFPMIPSDELAELAEDIKENGLNEPLVVAKVGDEWMLIDGRNRREACRIAEVPPAYRIVEANPDKLKSLVWSWNGPRRHLTSSQKAMAYAMMYPNGEKGGRGKKLLQNCNSLELSPTDKGNISRARFILKNAPEKADLVRDGHPDYPLSKTYDAVKAEVEERARKAEEERQKLEKLTALRGEYPDLASLVDEGRIYLDEAIETAESRTRKAKEKAEQEAWEAAEQERQAREAEEARLEEEERLRREEERRQQQDYENARTGFFMQLHNLINGTSVAVNDVQVQQLDLYVNNQEWGRFQQEYRHQKHDVLRTLNAFLERLPTLIDRLEKM